MHMLTSLWFLPVLPSMLNCCAEREGRVRRGIKAIFTYVALDKDILQLKPKDFTQISMLKESCARLECSRTWTSTWTLLVLRVPYWLLLCFLFLLAYGFLCQTCFCIYRFDSFKLFCSTWMLIFGCLRQLILNLKLNFATNFVEH